MKSLFHFLIIFVLFVSSSLKLHSLFAQTNLIFINEFMASNEQTIADEFNEYDDWIELYNDNEYAIKLSNYYLTDDFDEPQKWALPDTLIIAKGFLIIWADGSPEQGKLHADFKLDASGEEIGISDGNIFIDSFQYGEQSTDISYGRMPDAGLNWYFFRNPSPNAPNDTTRLPIAETPNFSYQSGFYTSAINLQLSTNLHDAKIYYTTDGSDPTPTSKLYTASISINTTMIIRARTFKNNYYPSAIVTNSYFINEERHLPVISLVTDPDNLWDPDSGIYVTGNDQNNPNFKQDWERPASVHFFKQDGQLGFAADVGIRIHGGVSVWFAKKSFRIYFRDEYGASWLQYPLFHVKDIDQFKRLVLSSGANDSPSDKRSDTQAVWSLIRDVLMHDLSYCADGLFTAKQPAFVYLNGKPWGIYYLSERIDEYYLQTNYGVEETDLIEFNDYAKIGTEDQWHELITFLENNDIQLQKNYEIATQLIDIPSFINYNVVEIYGGNRDWPHNNCLCYRPHGDNQLWRWIMWDADVTFGSPPTNDAESNTLLWAIRLEPCTLVLRSLFENELFQRDFINRFADLLNTLFLPNCVTAKIDSLAAIIRQEIPTETALWGSHSSVWERHVAAIKEYVELRPAEVRKHIKNKLKIGSLYKLTINPPLGGEGKVKVNSIYPTVYPWTGIYFGDIPITLRAEPVPGYQFTRWSDPSLPDTEIVTVNKNSDYAIFPHFEKEIIPGEIVINEINYHSAADFNPEDWIEFYNPNDKAIVMAGWHFKDKNDDNDFAFPSNAIINAHGFLVICRDTTQFNELFPDVSCYYGNLDFNLAEGGESIRLFSPSGVIIDSVTYDDRSPWPAVADGEGATLELIDYSLDNSVAENWLASIGHGTPGKINSISYQVSYHFPEQGSYLISLPMNCRDQSLQSLFPTALAAYTFQGKGYLPVTELEVGLGYWIIVPEATTIKLFGNKFNSYTRHFNNGWYLIGAVGYPIDFTDPNDSPDQSITAVYGWDDTNKKYYHATILEPKKGYLIYAKQECDLIVEANLQINNLSSNGSTSSELVPPLPPQLHQVSHLNVVSHQFRLLPSYPNPFNLETKISYQLPYQTDVTLKIYNVGGKLIRTFENQSQNLGCYIVIWDGKDEYGHQVSSGLYFYQIIAGEFNEIGKCLLLK